MLDQGNKAKLRTHFYDMHIASNAKMVEFAGYDMPIQYPQGILAEHQQVRTKAGLFDVSHMGQILFQIHPQAQEQEFEKSALCAFLDHLLPCSIKELNEGAVQYSLLLNEQAGIIDDLLVYKLKQKDGCICIYMVINASRKEQDLKWISSKLHEKAEWKKDIILNQIEDRALLAFQGPKSSEILKEIIPGVQDLSFMNAAYFDDLIISRTGYTGEDGFEISVPFSKATKLAQNLLSHQEDVTWIGLGARDSLRLEAGLCLYGQDLTEEINPLEANLKWVLHKNKLAQKSFIGSEQISRLEENPSLIQKKRVGIKPLEKIPARHDTPVYAQNQNDIIGIVTSGTFSPTLSWPIAVGYVRSEYAQLGQEIYLKIRDKMVRAEIVKLPFVPHRYFKKSS